MRIRRWSLTLLLCCVSQASIIACSSDATTAGGGSGSSATSGASESGSRSGAASSGVASGSASGVSGAAGGTDTSGSTSGAAATGSAGGASGTASGTGAAGASGTGTGPSDASTATSGSSTTDGDAGPGPGTGTQGNDAAGPGSGGALAGAAALNGLAGSATRPQLTTMQAAEYTIANYFAQSGTLGSLVADPWDPTAGVTLPASTTYTVGTGGKYATVQAAVDAASAAGGTAPLFIQIAPGMYTEQVCIKASAPPITLYGTGTDPTKTVIMHADFQGGIPTLGSNACANTDANQQAATVDAFNTGFQAKNLTIQNSVTNAQISNAPDGGSTASQAVALATTGDKVILDNVQVLSHQDTLYIDAPKNTMARVYAKGSVIAGDVDFIFGAATAVFDHCTLEVLSDRQSSSSAGPLAPDTDSRNAYGFLITQSAFTGDANVPAGKTPLGRAWDHSCSDTTTYVTDATKCVPSGAYPNGQASVENTTISGAFSRTTPWAAAATTKRGYSSVAWACVTGKTCPANRLYEFNNSGAGSASGM